MNIAPGNSQRAHPAAKPAPAKPPLSVLLLTRREAAGLLKVCLRKLDSMIAAQEVEIVRLDRSVRIRGDSLERLIESHTVRRRRNGAA